MLRRSKKTIAVPVVTARRAAAFRRHLIVLGLKAGVGAAAVGAAAVVARRKLAGGETPQAAPHVTPAASTVPPVKSMASVAKEPTEESAAPEAPATPGKPATAEEPATTGVPLDADEKESVDDALATSFEKGDEPGYP